jgi:hypothetical protein
VNQNAHKQVSNFAFEEGYFSVKIYNSADPTQFICPHYKKTRIPRQYFNNSDYNPKRKVNPARWRVIKKEMERLQIKKISIELCWTSPLIVSKK